ncbi:MAG: dihydrofolate reductase family protein [Acidobacteriota bacterium]|nr:dihydrofolate reductase family protein [Acidobacteriota bacterium]
MRKITYGCANSLDNYIARPDHTFDWIMHGKEAMEVLSDYWKTIDTILMGRKTYEVTLQHSKGKNPSAGMKTYVFSRTLKSGEMDGVEIVSADAAEFVRRLKNEEGKDISLMGGGEFAKALLEENLVDEIGLNIHPVLLGRGIPLFLEMNHQIDLELIESRPFKNGCVFVSYRVKNSAAKSRGIRKAKG